MRAIDSMAWRLVFARYQVADRAAAMRLFLTHGGYGRRIVTGGLAAAGGVAAIAVGLTAVVAIAPSVDGDRRFAEYRCLREQSLGIGISDRADRWLGLVPGALTNRAGQVNPIGVVGRILPTPNVPPGYWRILRALEDKAGARTLNGVNVERVMLAAIAWPLDLLHLRFGGASGLPAQLVRSLRGLAPDMDAGLGERIERKVTEIWDGPSLFAHLGGYDDPRFQKWVADSLTCAVPLQGTGAGPEVRGIATIAKVFWNSQPDELSLARQAVLAACVQKPLLIASGDPEEVKKRDREWLAIKALARSGLRTAFGEGAPETKDAIAELDSMPVPVPWLDQAFHGPLADKPARATIAAANPEARPLALARSPVTQALANRAAPRDGGGPDQPSSIQLSVDAASNLVLSKRIERELPPLEKKFAKSLSARLSPGGAGPHADILAAVSDIETGEVVGLYTSMERQIWGEGAGRDIGSLVKKIAAVALAAETTDSPRARYCNRRVDRGRIHNPDGSVGFTNCRARGATVSATMAFAKSQSLAVIDALRRVDDSWLRRLAELLDIHLNPGVQPRIGLALGMASASPVELLQMAGTVANIAWGKPVRGAIPWLRTDRAVSETRPLPLSLNENRQEFLRALLMAPLEKGGTLEPLGRAMAGRSDVADLLAKSGTTTSGDAIRDKWILGSFKTAQRRLAFLVLVGAPDPRQALGQHVPTAIVTTLAAVAIDHLATHVGQTQEEGDELDSFQGIPTGR